MVQSLTSKNIKPHIKSGTDEARKIFNVRQLDGLMGLDLGYGGDSIHPEAINMDTPRPYTIVGNDPQHLRGDARSLEWFADGTLDYVYSSHLLEDFQDTKEVLSEWARVVKTGGLIILVLPNEQEYRAHCKKWHEVQNEHHTIENMSIEYMTPIIEESCTIKEAVKCGCYSFLIIAEKRGDS